ncbi:hypothetical protein AB4Y90_05650 [Chryseobacterium sp. 2TAF14]|uniref:hypothetical protein n=1 Tax=Chryseobacterium sp. 2TAF14 TaxID=3233007 RepID=UPI003F91BCDF
MLKTFDEKLSGFLFVVILPFLLFFMSYYGFESSYTHFKTSERPPDFLFSSVYSYRIIPNYLSIYMTDFMEYCINSNVLLPFKNLLIKNGTPFYHGLFLMNTVFFILCSGIINMLLKFRPLDIFQNIKARRIVHLLMVFFIVMTQYTPSNCDTIALFCYLVGIVLTLKYLHTDRNLYFYLLIVLIAVSTLVRETACLNIAFFASVFFSMKESFMEGIYVVANFTSPFNLAGLFFSAIAAYFMYKLCADEESRLVFKRYLFFSLPYIVMITLVGLFWEVRLFLPIILTGALVACLDFKKKYN